MFGLHWSDRNAGRVPDINQGGAVMKNKKLSSVHKLFLLDLAGFLVMASKVDTASLGGFSNILLNVQHDIHGILTMKPEDCFSPRTSGYARHLFEGGVESARRVK